MSAANPSDTAAHRYTTVAIVLHWAIAIAIFGQIALGWWMGDALDDRETQSQAIAAFQLHKSIGLTILALSLFRLGWRFTHKAPPYPEHMPTWEKRLARGSQWSFYGLMILLPLSGWLYVSTGWSAEDDRPLEVPTLFFGLFQVPHLFGALSEDMRRVLGESLGFTHSKLVWVTIIMAVMHAGAALKHHFWDKDAVLTHMIPGLQPRVGDRIPADPRRRASLIGGFAMIAIATAVLVYLFYNPQSATWSAPSAPVQQQSILDPALAPAAESPDAVEAPVAPGEPPSWRVDASASFIGFAGQHAGIDFSGRFGAWSATIRFDPANLDSSSADVTIQTGSARDGVPLHDQSLPQAEWFDVANHPTATFRTTRIRHRDGNEYEARGTLTIKGKAIDVDLPFTLTINGNRAVMAGRVTVRRDEADLGMDSDPSAEYVSRDIIVDVHVEATARRDL